jgi:hypothetical protein
MTGDHGGSDFVERLALRAGVLLLHDRGLGVACDRADRLVY